MIKILIVDDEVAILQALSFFLEQEGYSVDTVSKFNHYFAGLNSSQLPDVIILDILLNQEDGIKITQELKSDNKTKHIPIILISALPEGRKLSKTSGADAFLAKPFNVSDLNDTIENVLSNSNTKHV